MISQEGRGGGGGVRALLHTPTRSAPERIVLSILINGKTCLQNESIDLFTLKTIHLICRKLGYASLIFKNTNYL